jgi:3'-phosphoadenosine 5'-phosphosulfate sulfotransferase
MLSATGDERRDQLTLENTIRNQRVDKVEDSLQKPKANKSLKINLENNITYAFDKQQQVDELIALDHQ